MRNTIATLLAAALLAACARDAPPDAAPPGDSATPSAPAVPEAEPMPAPVPESAPPADAPPPPVESNPAPTPTATPAAPAVETMRLARARSKLGVAADVRYSFDPAPAAGQPATLHLAVIPRVAGQPLEFSLQPAPGVESVAAGPITRQKLGGVDAQRRQYAVTRTAAAPESLKVLVTLTWDGGSTFGFYSIPLD
jgi:hypothetical protein